MRYFVCCSILFLIPFSSVFAGFNPHFIITDADLQDSQAMTLEDIQNFLEQKGSGLAKYYTNDTAGAWRSSAEIIWRAGHQYQINPKFLLVLLQKEQGLIANSSPSLVQLNWAMGYGLCDACDPSHPQLAAYQGFARQVELSAWRFQYYFSFPQEFRFQIGKKDSVTDKTVSPLNQATAALYNYTPHYQGNYNFWKIWNRWFELIYPDGSLLKTKKQSTVWLIQNDQRRAFQNYSVFIDQYQPQQIITISQREIDKYEIGAPVKFVNYSLLRLPSGSIFLLSDEALRPIASWEVFRKIGFNPEEIINVQPAEIESYATSTPLTLENLDAEKKLQIDKESGMLYHSELDGSKHFVKFRDGALVKAKNQPETYLISNGQRRHIVSETVFEKLGYKWKNIIETTPELLALHPFGEPMDLRYKN